MQTSSLIYSPKAPFAEKLDFSFGGNSSCHPHAKDLSLMVISINIVPCLYQLPLTTVCHHLENNGFKMPFMIPYTIILCCQFTNVCHLQEYKTGGVPHGAQV